MWPVLQLQFTRPQRVVRIIVESLRPAWPEPGTDEKRRPLMDLPRGDGTVDILLEVIVLLLLDDAPAGDQGPGVGQFPLDLAEQRVGIRLQRGIGAQIEGCAGNDAVDREFEAIVGVGIDIEIEEAADPGHRIGLAIETEFLGEAGSVNGSVVG